jgi:hypothetical protein
VANVDNQNATVIAISALALMLFASTTQCQQLRVGLIVERVKNIHLYGQQPITNVTETKLCVKIDVM